ncbi:ABC transporter substrate-binding protein [Acetobacter lambici]|uniref:ABC transporter substrate-binding protein n=2 Tax=Acetobacter lambici TaxID=1332824 RepID=A0ABT1F3M5_9PROT|nr:ABC transporter substrate-binding protein [Acetobacter lambici]MCP1258748.1 ABC transporter substrate-binding protein [Acetobacter lambici]NHO57055.1 ABC transporter substrate-binding protein [Acetobacter lambici]
MLNRRNMIKQGTRMVAASMCATRPWLGVARAADGRETTTGPVEAGQWGTQPRTGGHVRAASTSGSLSDTLDPARQSMATDYLRGNMFYDGLVALDETLTPRPALAQSIESSDFQTWHIQLRSGVCFHDGAPLTSADVVYSILRHKDPALGSQVHYQAMAMHAVRADGPLGVVIELAAPNIAFPSVLGLTNFAIIRDGTTRFETANGTGPFTCAVFQPGVRSVALRNTNFWNPGGVWVDSLELISISDDMARHNALLSGDVDIIAAVDPRLVALVRKRNIAVMESPTGTYTNLAIRQDVGPGENADFVQAMKLLFNREQMRNSIYLGFCRAGNDQPLPPEHRFCNTDLPQTVYDPDKARFLLKKNGFLNQSLPPLICSPAANGSVEMAVLLQNAAQNIGLRLDVRRMPADGYWSQSWMRFPMGFGNVNPRASADMTFALSFASTAPWNEAHWRDPRFDQLLVLSRQEPDETRRHALYNDMQAMIHAGSGVCIPSFITSLDGFHPRIQGLHPHQGGQLMGYNFARHIWVNDQPASAKTGGQ